MGVLTAVQKRQGKGKPYERAEGLDLSEGSTVTLLEASVRELIREHPSEGLCYGRFDADLIADSGGEGFAVGDRIAIGPVLLKVDSGKQCYPECERKKNSPNPASLPKSSANTVQRPRQSACRKGLSQVCLAAEKL